METGEQQVERLMSLNADTELRFDDGALPANSNVLSLFSSVLHGAIEAHSGDDNSNHSSTSSPIVIQMQGLTKAQWLKVAQCWLPVQPAAAVRYWARAELLLRVGSRFDMRPAFWTKPESS